MAARKLLLRLVVVALCATAGVAILVLLAGSFDETSDRILLTTTSISLFGLLAVPAGMLLERGIAVALARASAALTSAAFVLTIVGIWTPDIPWGVWRAWGVVATLALAAAQVSAVEARRRDNDSPTVRALTTGSSATGALLAVLGALAIVGELRGFGFYRAIGALGVLDVLQLAVIALLRRGTGPIAQQHRLRVDGLLVEAPGRDFAAAVASAIRDAERNGERVRRIERA